MARAFVDGEPGLGFSFLGWFLEGLFGWYNRHFGRKLSFGELFMRFEEEERFNRLLREKGFTFRGYG